ncbi:DNA-binding protein, partial [Erysipelatoclostridium ramosum]|nr:DNA-binding protein [Thomasclavelia ramosa]
TAVLTTKIKELQHFAKFDQIFVLSLLILLTNLLVKGIILFVTQKKEEKKARSVRMKKYALGILAGGVVLFTFVFGQGKEPVVIYSNADEEALVAIQHAL